jgi:hypothetical protein
MYLKFGLSIYQKINMVILFGELGTFPVFRHERSSLEKMAIHTQGRTCRGWG